jgi:hypothetical protein
MRKYSSAACVFKFDEGVAAPALVRQTPFHLGPISFKRNLGIHQPP